MILRKRLALSADDQIFALADLVTRVMQDKSVNVRSMVATSGQ